MKTKAERLPRGFRRGHGDELACPHRDVSVCDECAKGHPEIVEVYGVHYWIEGEAERDSIRGLMARGEAHHG